MNKVNNAKLDQELRRAPLEEETVEEILKKMKEFNEFIEKQTKEALEEV